MPPLAKSSLVEHGEHGSTAAAPIARQMFELYFRDRIEGAKAEELARKEAKKRPKKQTAEPTPAVDDEPVGGGGLDSVPGLSPEEL